MLRSKHFFPVICCLFAALCAIFYISAAICHDGFFSYRQGEDILFNNGLSTTNEYITVHDFPFQNHRILQCIIAYFVGLGGLPAFNIASFCYICVLFGFLFKSLLAVSNRGTISIKVLVFLSFVILGNYAAFRANVLMACLMVVMINICERLKSDNCSSTKFLIYCAVLGCLSMNLQSSSFYMPVFSLMIYLFDFPFLSRGEATQRKEQWKLLGVYWLGLCTFLVGGLVNPYGFDSFSYCLKCLSAMHCDYVAIVTEMQVKPFSIPALVVYASTLLACFYMFKYKRVIPRILFLCLGSCALCLVAIRMQFFALVFIICALSMLASNLGINFAATKHSVITIVLRISAVFVFFIWVLAYISVVTRPAFAVNYAKRNSLVAADIFIANDVDLSNTRIFTPLSNANSYLEYLGAKTYIDCRAEFFDIYFNGEKDVFNEYLSLIFASSMTSFDYDAFQSEYNFDYYVVYSDFFPALSQWLTSRGATCNFSNDVLDLSIYSFSDTRVFNGIYYGSEYYATY